MSGFPPPGAGAYDEEVERQLQEEFRRRQVMQQAGSALGGPPPPAATFSALTAARARGAAAGGGPGDYAGHLGMLGVGDPSAAGSPYGARQHPAAYPRVGDPYAGLVGAQQAAAARAAAAYGAPGPDGAASLSDLYASHQHQQKQAAIQQAYATYGAAAGTPSAAGANAHLRYAGPYNPLPGPEQAYVTSAPPPDLKTAQEIAIMQEAYQRERENALKRRGGGAYPPPAAASAGRAGSPSRSPPSTMKSPGKAGGKSTTPRTLSTPKSASTTTSSAVSSPTSSPRKKETAVLSKDKDGKAVVEDRGHIWYMGAVPLGVDDDKYWLSELQVFLRSSFAEAFAATEEDIAAPMHGRNKPIALGQVGIRCMHCKRKFCPACLLFFFVCSLFSSASVLFR